MILSFLGLPCYLVVAAGLAFWRPVVSLIICGVVVGGVDHQGADAHHR